MIFSPGVLQGSLTCQDSNPHPRPCPQMYRIVGSESSLAMFALFLQLTWERMLALILRSLNVSGLGAGGSAQGVWDPSCSE